MKKIVTMIVMMVLGITLIACDGQVAPTISGVADKTIKVNESFNALAGVTAKDADGNDLTQDIEVSGVVNVNVASVYTLTYSVSDSKGVRAEATRKITVVEDNSLTKEQKEEQLVKAFVAFMGTQQGKATIQENGGIVEITKQDPSWSSIKSNYPVVDMDNKDIVIKFGGSTSVEKIAKALSTQFSGLAGNFVAQHGHTGSGDAFKRTQGAEKDGANALHIAFASRKFNDDEKAGMKEGSYGQLAFDAVVAVVHKENPLSNITAEQLKSIYNHTFTNWADLGGSNADIASYTRDSSSGTREAFFEVIGLSKSHNEGALGSVVVDTNGSMITSVSGNMSGIGYISLSGLSQTNLKGLFFNGVEPTEQNVIDNLYDLKRPFNYVIRY